MVNWLLQGGDGPQDDLK